MLGEVKRAFSDNKLAIHVSIAILFIFLILGYFLEPYVYSYFNPVVEEFARKVQTGEIRVTFLSIFSNNIRIVFLMFISGLVLCFSALILAFNGFFVGYYIAQYNDIAKALLLIIPHGIFEFSSCILACASGFVLFNFMYKFLKTLYGLENKSVKELISVSFNESSYKLKQAIILLAFASLLMAIAGFVETYLTLPVARFLLNFI